MRSCYARTASPGQKQAVGAAGNTIAALGTLCRSSAVIPAPEQPCLKGRGSDPSAEWDGDHQWKTFPWRWLELLLREKAVLKAAKERKIKEGRD